MMFNYSFTVEPHEGFFDSLWPVVSQKIDGDPGEGHPTNGGGGKVEEGQALYFKSSSAMQILTIPQPSHPVDAAPERMAPPPLPSHPWRWPVAFVFSTAIAMGGFLYYKKTFEPPPLPQLVAAPTWDNVKPGAEPKVALATPLEAGASSSDTETAEPSVATEASTAGKSATKLAKAHRGKGAGDKADPSESKAEAKATGKGEAPSASQPPAKKGDELDNLIDNVIGKSGAPTPASKKEAVAAMPADPDLPASLTMNQITASMKAVSGLVQACYDQYQIEGMANVSFTIQKDGLPKDVTIKGKFFGTDTGTCVVTAVKKARFPKYSGNPIKIPNYPFQLQ
jgi:hypothetical protein